MEARNDAVSLLNEAKKKEKVEELIQILDRLLELVFKQEPSLLNDFFPLILEFEKTPEVSVRKWVTVTIQTVCTKHPELSVSAVPVILAQIVDEDAIVVKHALNCMVKLYHHILFLIANATFVSSSHISLWGTVCEIKAKVLEFFNLSGNTQLIAHSTRMVEAVILAQSEAKSVVPQNHMILNVDKLNENTQSFFTALTEKLFNTTTTNTNAMIILSALMIIGKRCSDFIGVTIDTFVKYHKYSSENLSKMKLRSMEKHLKFVILTVLRATSPDWPNELSETLSLSGILQMACRFKPASQSTKDQKDQKDQIDVRPILLRNMPPVAVITPQLQQQLQALNSLPIQLMVAIVEHGIQSLQFPSELEPLELPEGEDENTLVHLIATAISPDHRQQQLKRPEPEIDTRTDKKGGISQNSSHGTQGGKHEIRSVKSDGTIDFGFAPMTISADEKTQKRKAAMGTGSVPPRKRIAVARDSKPEPKSKRPADYTLKESTLTKKTSAKLLGAAFNRIIVSEQGAIQGGEPHLRIQILSNLATKRPLSESTIQSLIDHIARDFPARLHLALQWLYAEWTCNTDNGKRYHAVLRRLLITMRVKLKPSDKLLTTFLLKIPHIPKDVYDHLHEYCQDTKVIERMSLGLYTLRDLALQRPPCRGPVLRLLLKYTAHQNEALRTAAIRLVTGNLLPHQMFADHILGFATKLLRSLVPDTPADIKMEQSDKATEKKQEEMEIEDEVKSTNGKPSDISIKAEPKSGDDDIEIDEHITRPADLETVAKLDDQYVGDLHANDGENLDGQDKKGTDEGMSSTSSKKTETSQFDDEDIKRRLLLYFHLCAKRHELLKDLVDVYCKVDQKVKRMIHRQAGGLIRTIGMTSPALLNLLHSFPPESKTFILGVLHILTEGQTPTPELVAKVKDVYENRLPDARLLIPILPGLTKNETIAYLPKLVELPTNIVKTVISRILHNKPSPLSPSELLIALHLMDPKTVSLKKAIEAIQLCFDQKVVVRQEVLAKVLQQLVDTTPIPPLFLRTVIQTIGHCRQMMSFIMGILKALIVKQLWNDKRLWQGFVKCCKMTLPNSIPILLQLPPPQFEEALQKVPSFATAIVSHQRKHKKQIPKPYQQVLQLFETTEGIPTSDEVVNLS